MELLNKPEISDTMRTDTTRKEGRKKGALSTVVGKA
jgi:hypothetical protein